MVAVLENPIGLSFVRTGSLHHQRRFLIAEIGALVLLNGNESKEERSQTRTSLGSFITPLG